MKLNSYFEHLSSYDSIPIDSFLVYYEDSLYYIDEKRIQDTFHLNFSMNQFIEEKDNIQHLSLRLTIRNGYPTKAETQVYLYYGRQVLDSLFSEKLVIEPGEVNEEHNVFRPSYQQHDVPLDFSKINNLYRADHSVFHGWFYVTTESLEEIKLYEDYKVNAKIGLQAKSKFTRLWWE